MGTTTRVAYFVENIAPGQLFTTGDCLAYGLRGAVDQALYVLVKAKMIIRAADGLFYKPGADISRPTKLEIINAKAAAFGRKIMTLAKESAKNLGLLEEEPENFRYATNGRSSSFVLRESGDRVNMIGTSERKTTLADSSAGIAILALWHLGQAALSPQLLTKATSKLGPSDLSEFRYSRAKMPAWLGDFVYRAEIYQPKQPMGSVTAA